MLDYKTCVICTQHTKMLVSY